MAKVFIGMPVYNGERFITEAIKSLLSQSYEDWNLFISDNASEDETQNICVRYANLDDRITYFRQENNIGAVANFKFLLDKAEGEYFMWAAADDLWHNDFLNSRVQQLEKDKTYGMAFCNIVNVDSFERIIRSYPDFSKFVGNDRFAVLSSFLHDPEIMGKANIFYSVYRLEICHEVWKSFPLSDDWGADNCFIVAALARTKLAIDSRVLFAKRIATSTDEIGKPYFFEVAEPQKHIFPLHLSIQYLLNHLKAVRHTPYYDITMRIMMVRIELAVKNFIERET